MMESHFILNSLGVIINSCKGTARQNPSLSPDGHGSPISLLSMAIRPLGGFRNIFNQSVELSSKIFLTARLARNLT
jgi:hypothetical protein